MNLSANVCWKCGFSKVFVDIERLQEQWFRNLAIGVWEHRGWYKVPAIYEETITSIATKTRIPREFLIHHIDAFIEWINDPNKLFAHAVSQEYESRTDVESNYGGLVFRKEEDGEELKIVLDDRRTLGEQ